MKNSDFSPARTILTYMQKDKIKILVVDDSETHRQFLTYVLDGAGYNVIEAKDGLEALKRASEERPTMIISDILMPEMDGYEMIEKLKKDKELSSIKIILYTAQFQKEEAIKLAKLFGISHYLDKPTTKEKLLSMVEEALQIKEQPLNKADMPNAEEIAKQHLDLINSKLFKQVSDLEKLKSELEQRIAERTEELEKLNEKLHEDSIHDPLTGLFNRRYLDDFIDLEIARSKRKNKNFVVAMLDIDFFKKFNDQYGHQVGDKVLYQIAEYLKKHLRPEDVVCRFGGEEFTLILVNCLESEVLERLEALRKGVESLEIETDHGKIKSTTVSMGFAIFPKHGIDPKKLIEASDSALYEAKELGRNRVIAYKPK